MVSQITKKQKKKEATKNTFILVQQKAATNYKKHLRIIQGYISVKALTV